MSESASTAIVLVPRPTSRYNAWPDDVKLELVSKVAELLAFEGMTRKLACVTVGVPERTYVNWITHERECWQLHARARQEQAHTLADEALDIARSRSAHMTEAQDKRTHIDTIKWRCAKLHPRTYGDKQMMELTGADGGPIAIDAQVWAVGLRRVKF